MDGLSPRLLHGLERTPKSLPKPEIAVGHGCPRRPDGMARPGWPAYSYSDCARMTDISCLEAGGSKKRADGCSRWPGLALSWHGSVSPGMACSRLSPFIERTSPSGLARTGMLLVGSPGLAWSRPEWLGLARTGMLLVGSPGLAWSRPEWLGLLTLSPSIPHYGRLFFSGSVCSCPVQTSPSRVSCSNSLCLISASQSSARNVSGRSHSYFWYSSQKAISASQSSAGAIWLGWSRISSGSGAKVTSNSSSLPGEGASLTVRSRPGW